MLALAVIKIPEKDKMHNLICVSNFITWHSNKVVEK